MVLKYLGHSTHLVIAVQQYSLDSIMIFCDGAKIVHFDVVIDEHAQVSLISQDLTLLDSF